MASASVGFRDLPAKSPDENASDEEGKPASPVCEAAVHAAEMCKALLDSQTMTQQMLWWDNWAKRWSKEFLVNGRIRDEQAQTVEARRIRKICKESKVPKEQTAKQVEEALVQLEFVVPPCIPPKIPQIEDDFHKQQLALLERRVQEAGRRIDGIKNKQEHDQKSENDAAVSKATLGKKGLPRGICCE
jgi:hypothetical protein